MVSAAVGGRVTAAALILHFLVSYSHGTTRNALVVLVKAGEIERVRVGRYRIAPSETR